MIAYDQCNLTKGRIAAAHGRLSGIREVAQVCRPPNACFLASWNFLYTSNCLVAVAGSSTVQ